MRRAVVAAAMVALAGCIGSSDEPPASGDRGEDRVPAPAREPGVVAEEPLPHPFPGTEWTIEEREGRVEGLNLLFATSAIAYERITAEQGEIELRIIVFAEDAPTLRVSVSSPSCFDGAFEPCEPVASGSTEDGDFEFSEGRPDPGLWLVELWCADPGPCDAPYRAQLAHLAPVVPPSEMRWRTEHRDGTVNGVNGTLVGSGLESEHIVVRDGTRELGIVVRATATDDAAPADLDVTLHPPTAVGGDHRGHAGSDPLVLNETRPEPGEWTLSLSCGDVGPCNVDYDVHIDEIVRGA